jgi:hypothetical protein
VSNSYIFGKSIISEGDNLLLDEYILFQGKKKEADRML